MDSHKVYCTKPSYRSIIHPNCTTLKESLLQSTLGESIEVLHGKKKKKKNSIVFLNNRAFVFILKLNCGETAPNEREATTTAEI